jgi:hypothetical protein
MAKISTYTTDNNVTGADKVIGTDADNMNMTKNFTVSSLAQYVQSAQTGYGSFFDTTNQTTTSGTPRAMNLDTTVLSNGVTVEDDISNYPTQITVSEDGVYNLAFSAQVYRSTGGSDADLDIWIKVNGVDVPFSNTKITLKANAKYVVAAWNFFVPLLADDYVQIMWMHDDSIELVIHDATSTTPATPSVIVTVNRIK